MGLQDFINVKIQAKNTTKTVKIEKGCSFENNGSIYHVTNNGKLTVFDKDNKSWTNTDLIKMTGYQYSVFQAVANNVNEKNNNKPIGDIVLSKKDIDKSLQQFKEKTLKSDLSELLPMGYKIDKEMIYSKYKTVKAYVDGDNEAVSGSVIIGYGTQRDAQIMSELNVKTKQTAPKTVTKTNINKVQSKGSVAKASDAKSAKNTAQISKKHYIDRSKTTPLPEYFANKVEKVRIKMGMSKQNFENEIKKVAKHVGYSEYFIKCIIASENYEPKVRNTKDGTITGGFGHSKLRDKNIKLGQKVPPQIAFKWLKSDIKFFEKKVKELKLDEDGKETMGKYFNKLPLSMREAMLDVAFNRDHRKLANAEEYNSLRANIKNGEEYLPACAVRLRQDFSQYTHKQKLGHKFTTGLMERNCYRFLLAIRDFDDEYRAIAKRRFESTGHYYTETLKLKREKGYSKDAQKLAKAWNAM